MNLALPIASGQALNDPSTQYIEGRLAGRRIWWCPSGYGEFFDFFSEKKIEIKLKYFQVIWPIAHSPQTGTATTGVAHSRTWAHGNRPVVCLQSQRVQ